MIVQFYVLTMHEETTVGGVWCRGLPEADNANYKLNDKNGDNNTRPKAQSSSNKGEENKGRRKNAWNIRGEGVKEIQDHEEDVDRNPEDTVQIRASP